MLVAACLKAYEFLQAATPASIKTMATIAGEWTLGVWFISGIARRIAWGAAVVTFASFMVYNVIQALGSAESCGCFGKIQIDPWYTAAFDACVLSALIVYPPGRTRAPPPWWGSRVASTLLLLGLGGLAVLALSAQRAGPPKFGLVPNAYSHDFGTLELAAAAHAEHIFQLRNTSDQPIRIVKSTSTCGCTVASPPSAPVMPGETVPIRITTDWSHRGGRQLEQVRLATDHPATGTIVLSVAGDVRTMAALTPSVIHFGGLKLHEEATRLASLHAREQSFQITKVEISCPQVSIVRLDEHGHPVPQSPLEGKAGRFQIAFRPTVAGRQSARVTFHTNLADQPRLGLEIRAEVSPPIVVQPASLLFRIDAPVQALRILAPGAPVAEVIAGDFVVDRIRPVPETGGAIEVTIRWTRTDVGPMQRGVLRITTDDAVLDVPLMAVPF